MNTSPYSFAQTRELRAQLNVGKLLECGDVSRWWCTHISETMPTAVIEPGRAAAAFGAASRPRIGATQARTNLGELSLAEFLGDARSGARGFLVLHKGEVAYEAYPGMTADMPHLWASCAKPAAGLLVDLLIEDGAIDETLTLGNYFAPFRGTDWADVSVHDAMDMAPGLDCEENPETRADPSSIAIRAFLAEFGTPFRGKVETLLDVLKDSRRVGAAGQKFEYGSPCTQALVFLAEAVTGRTWSDLFRERVWAHVGAEGPLQMHQSPDGVALAHGVASSRLRDMARFGMLFTPSWRKIASRKIVSDDILARIRRPSRRHEFFRRGFNGPRFIDYFGDNTIIANSRQWDAVWPDGDFFKSGFMGQGLYVSPDRDLVIAYFSTTPEMYLMRYLRPIAASFNA